LGKMKSPIRENTNNFKCLPHLRKLIPAGSVVNSFLFYDGSLEINLADQRRFVIGHTTQYVIYEFWDCALANPQRIASIAKELNNLRDPSIFYMLQENWPKYKDPYVRSALFFILNRCSDTGDISAGKFNAQTYNPIALSHLNKFKLPTLHVQLDQTENFIEGIKNVKDTDYLLLPVGKFSYNFFEHGKNRGFEMTTVDHKKLSEALREITDKWVTVYKNHHELYKLYKDYNVTMLNKHGKITTDKNACEEVVIANF